MKQHTSSNTSPGRPPLAQEEQPRSFNWTPTTKRRLQPVTYLSVPCSCCLVLLRYQYINTVVVQGFSLSSRTPRRDTLRKNKKCRTGDNSHNTSGHDCGTSFSSFDSDGFTPNPENTLFGSRNYVTSKESSFAVRMASASYEEEEERSRRDHIESLPMTSPMIDGTDEDSDTDASIVERRKFLHSLFAASAAANLPSTSALAYDKSYPSNLEFDNNPDAPSINLEAFSEDRIAVQKSRPKRSRPRPSLLTNPSAVQSKIGILGSASWGAALWLLSGSRSNPLVKPIANLVYDEESEPGSWVKGRNEGLFTPIPAMFNIVLGVVFLALGVLTDVAVLFVTQGEVGLTLQLAGVSFIAGGILELGRIASGEKMQTEEEMVRDGILLKEFEEFAMKRLVVAKGGSVHRSEVTRAFRRYFAKYRVENDEYPLVDLEIERLLRGWNLRSGREDISSAGFLRGVKINIDAEIR